MIRIRKAKESDLMLLFNWANDSVVRKNSFNEEQIHFEEHKEWFKRMMSEKDIVQYILEDQNQPVGQFRININEDVAEISYSVASKYRGQGYGHIILQRLVETVKNDYPSIVTFVAKVKPENQASMKLFEKEEYEMKYVVYEKQIRERLLN